MSKNNTFKLLINLPSIALGLGLASIFGFASMASALPLAHGAASKAGSNTSSSGSSTSKTSASQAAAVQSIIAKGNSEIERRLTSLSGLDSKISASTRLSSADQATLTSTVNNEVSGLTSLKATLDAATTLTAARSAAQSIFNDYRVYALICPQVNMVSAADHQQTVETSLANLETELATRINSSSSSTLQSDLTTITGDTTDAQKLSSNVETSVIGLTPSNYDQDHTILGQYLSDLKTAQADNQTAYGTAKTMISLLSSSSSSGTTHQPGLKPPVNK